MVETDKIATCYSNARELVKQNNPKAARAYVLALLNYAVETYNQASTILLKAKTQAFLDKWIAVSRELYDNGVTDYILQCFALPTKQEQKLPKTVKAVDDSRSKKTFIEADKINPSSNDKEIDIAGLIDETAKTQGWCADMFEKHKTAVVEITAGITGAGSKGTGVIISQNGYLLTNDHVVYDEDSQAYYSKAEMAFAGEKKSYKLNILFSDKKSDIALCSFDPESVRKFSVIKRIADYSQVLQGADCLVIGNSFGMGLAPFTGVIRFTKNNIGDLVYTAPSNPGDSGGPVLNRQGVCIGVNKSKTLTVNNVSADGYANATPMDEIDGLLKKWTKQSNILL